ncbi:PIG-L deacetylase family protein [Candidatus Omnitrophota bacterium]
MSKRNNVLAIVAHPDDEVLGCGGTIMRHLTKGDYVNIIVLADGVTAREYSTKVPRTREIKKHKKLIEIRAKEFHNSTKIMGIKKQDCYMLSFPDQRLDALPLLDIIKKIEKIAKKTKPNIIYTHHWGDLNKDHRVCLEATLTAFRPTKRENAKIAIYSFPISGNMNILQPKNMYKFKPNHFVDINKCRDRKIKALKAYKSEFSNLNICFTRDKNIKSLEGFVKIK